MGLKKFFVLTVLPFSLAVLSAASASAANYLGEKPCHILKSYDGHQIGVRKSNGACTEATWWYKTYEKSFYLVKDSDQPLTTENFALLDASPDKSICNCTRPNSSTAATTPPAAGTTAAAMEQAAANSLANANTVNAQADAATTALGQAQPAAGNTNNYYFGASGPKEEGQPVQNLSEDGKTRTTYVDNGDKVFNPKTDKILKKETGSTADGVYTPTSEINYAAADPEKNYKYSYAAEGGIKSTNSKAEVEAAAKASGGNITVMVNGKEKVINEKGELVETRGADGNTTYSKNSNGKDSKATSDPCSFSTNINGKYACQGTSSWIKGTDIGNKVLGTAGKTIVTTIGQTAAAKAQNGSMSSGYDGAVKMAKTSLNYEKALTAMNLYATAKLAKKTKDHKNNLAEMRNQTFDVDGNNTDKTQTGNQAHYAEAIKEQENFRNKAETATYATAMVGVQSLSNALVAKQIKDGAEKAALQARQGEALQRQPGIAWDPGAAITAGNSDPNQVPGGGGTDPNALPGGGTIPPDSGAAPTNGLGNGNDTSDGGKDVNSPPPGSFRAAAGGAGGGGSPGGGGAMGGGGGGGGAPSAEESKAGYASEFGTKERYESGSAGGAKGAGGKAGGKDDGSGVDLNGLLAQFLPKTEEDLGPKNGILDFAGGGRAPASADDSASYLDKNADLFQRIHETMSEKNRKGHVGI